MNEKRSSTLANPFLHTEQKWLTLVSSTSTILSSSTTLVIQKLMLQYTHYSWVLEWEWQLASGNVGHFMPQVTFTEDSYSDVITINRTLNEGYTKLDVRAGFSNDDLTAEVYVDNLTDERGEISNNFVFDVERVTYIRPTTVGIRFKQNF